VVKEVEKRRLVVKNGIEVKGVVLQRQRTTFKKSLTPI